MKIFLCWSGQASLDIAQALRDWLPDCIQALKPFMSTEDIRKGDRWRTEISTQLADTDFGILCLTPENLDSRWILFEAGALSKHVEKGHVTAALYKTTQSQVTEPLSQFQNTNLEENDVRRLIYDLNSRLPTESQVEGARLVRAFETYWPTLKGKLDAISARPVKTPASATRTTPDMVNELLELSRSQGRQIEQLKSTVSHLSITTSLGGQPWSAASAFDYMSGSMPFPLQQALKGMGWTPPPGSI